MSQAAQEAHAVTGDVRGIVRLSWPVELTLPLDRVGQIFAGTILPFALILCLALAGGGYDVLVRSEVGVAIWWIVLLGALVGVLPARGLGRVELLGLGLLLGLAAWTAIGIGWSESSERSVDEVSRVLTLLGVFALSLSSQDRGALGRTVRAVGAATVFVAGLSLLSRLEPSWFPATQSLPGLEARLAYPLNYWNALAALVAIGIPLVIASAVGSRRPITQAVATASLPVMGLTSYYTLSRGGVIEIAVALVVLLLLHPRRLDLLPTLALGAVGTAFVIGAAAQRHALQDNLGNATAAHQGHEMLAVVLVVCTGVALVRLAVSAATREGLWPSFRLPRRPRTSVLAGLGAAVVVVALIGGHGLISREWSTFKSPVGPSSNSSAQRFVSASGNGRYQYWSAAVHAFTANPVTGIGPGTYEFWWAQHGSTPGFVRNAHSLYLETLAELGIPGLALLLALVTTFFVVGVGALRRADSSQRALLAAALAGAAGFVSAAAIDWVWQVTVVPVAFLLLAGAVLRASGGRGLAGRTGKTDNQRIVLAILAISSLLVIGVPMLAVNDVRRSQDDVRSGHLASALSAASDAAGLESFAAAPNLQRALILEAQGNLDAATAAARTAAHQESTNWRTWLTLSRIEWESGRSRQAIAAYRNARALNPHSPLFQPRAGGTE